MTLPMASNRSRGPICGPLSGPAAAGAEAVPPALTCAGAGANFATTRSLFRKVFRPAGNLSHGRMCSFSTSTTSAPLRWAICTSPMMSAERLTWSICMDRVHWKADCEG